jgi:hypothetical protein
MASVPNASSVEYVNYPLDIDVHRFAAEAQVRSARLVRRWDPCERSRRVYRRLARGLVGHLRTHVGPKTEHEGKPLSQDAVIWVKCGT